MVDVLELLRAVLGALAAAVADIVLDGGALQHLVAPPGVVMDAGDGPLHAVGDPRRVFGAGQNQVALTAALADGIGDDAVFHGGGNGGIDSLVMGGGFAAGIAGESGQGQQGGQSQRSGGRLDAFHGGPPLLCEK